MKLHIERPEPIDDILWEQLHEKLMRLLVNDCDVDPANQDLCGAKIRDVLPDQQVKSLAVMVLGNDYKSTVTALGGMIIKGDGDCPDCGSNDREPVYEPVRYNTEEQGYCVVVGHRCKTCKCYEPAN